MAQVSLSLSAPSSVETTLIGWATPNVSYGDVSSLGADTSATNLLRQFFLREQTGNERNTLLRTASTATQDPPTAGPELSDAWEGSAVAVTVRAPTLPDLVIPGPSSSGLDESDATEPYDWRLSTTQDAAAYTNGASSGISGWITDFNGLTATQRGQVTLILDDGVTPTTDHTVDADPAEWSFATQQPTVTHTPAATPATISDVSVISTPSALADTYGPGEIIQIQVTYNTAVDVTGTPQFPTNLGQSPVANPDWFDYASGSGTTTLVFEWTVAATDEDTNGLWLHGPPAGGGDPDSMRLNGGTIRNAGSATDASLAIPAGVRGTQTNHKVDGSLGGTTAHAVDADPAEWSFATQQPTVTHTTAGPQSFAVDADPAEWNIETRQPSVRHTRADTGAIDTESLQITRWAENGDRTDPEDVGINRAVGYADEFSQVGGLEVSRAEWNQGRRELSGWAIDWRCGIGMLWDRRISFIHSATEASFTFHAGAIWRSTRPSRGEEPGVSDAWEKY